MAAREKFYNVLKKLIQVELRLYSTAVVRNSSFLYYNHILVF